MKNRLCFTRRTDDQTDESGKVAVLSETQELLVGTASLPKEVRRRVWKQCMQRWADIQLEEVKQSVSKEPEYRIREVSQFVTTTALPIFEQLAENPQPQIRNAAREAITNIKRRSATFVASQTNNSDEHLVKFMDEAERITAFAKALQRRVVIPIFTICAISFVYALTCLSGTWLGFGIAFGSSILAYECFLLFRMCEASTLINAVLVKPQHYEAIA